MLLLESCIAVINSGIMRKVSEVIIKKNKIVIQFLDCLWVHGYIHSYSILDVNKAVVRLKYLNGVPVVRSLTLGSSISHRYYYTWKQCVSFGCLARFKDAIFLTPNGFTILADILKRRSGGMLICKFNI